MTLGSINKKKKLKNRLGEGKRKEKKIENGLDEEKIKRKSEYIEKLNVKVDRKYMSIREIEGTSTLPLVK